MTDFSRHKIIIMPSSNFHNFLVNVWNVRKWSFPMQIILTLFALTHYTPEYKGDGRIFISIKLTSSLISWAEIWRIHVKFHV